MELLPEGTDHQFQLVLALLVEATEIRRCAAARYRVGASESNLLEQIAQLLDWDVLRAGRACCLGLHESACAQLAGNRALCSVLEARGALRLQLCTKSWLFFLSRFDGLFIVNLGQSTVLQRVRRHVQTGHFARPLSSLASVTSSATKAVAARQLFILSGHCVGSSETLGHHRTLCRGEDLVIIQQQVASVRRHMQRRFLREGVSMSCLKVILAGATSEGTGWLHLAARNPSTLCDPRISWH